MRVHVCATQTVSWFVLPRYRSPLLHPSHICVKTRRGKLRGPIFTLAFLHPRTPPPGTHLHTGHTYYHLAFFGDLFLRVHTLGFVILVARAYHYHTSRAFFCSPIVPLASTPPHFRLGTLIVLLVRFFYFVLVPLHHPLSPPSVFPIPLLRNVGVPHPSHQQRERQP